MKPYPRMFYTGTELLGVRMDDVINVLGDRLSTAEIESALVLHTGVTEIASEYNVRLYLLPELSADVSVVIGTADELTGQAIHTFVTLKP